MDVWTVVYAGRVREADPSHALDVPSVLARGLKACAAAESLGMVRKDRNPARRGMLVLGDRWGTSLDMRNLGRYYDPTCHHRQFKYWVSVRLDGNDLLCDRV